MKSNRRKLKLDVNLVFIYYFICHTIITKNKGKEREREKNEVAKNLTETIGAYERLGFLELRVTAV